MVQKWPKDSQIYSGHCNKYFEDRNGHSCQEYKYNKWCTSSGEYGDGWPENGGSFDDYSSNDESATVCPQCGCKGRYFYFQCYIPTWIAFISKNILNQDLIFIYFSIPMQKQKIQNFNLIWVNQK